jgi:hypothetical protein
MSGVLTILVVFVVVFAVVGGISWWMDQGPTGWPWRRK